MNQPDSSIPVYNLISANHVEIIDAAEQIISEQRDCPGEAYDILKATMLTVMKPKYNPVSCEDHIGKIEHSEYHIPGNTDLCMTIDETVYSHARDKTEGRILLFCINSHDFYLDARKSIADTFDFLLEREIPTASKKGTFGLD